jgi:serine/threonine protein kinase
LVNASKSTKGQCVECEADTYQEFLAHYNTECKQQPHCGQGMKVSEIGSSKVAQCESCEEGTFQNLSWHQSESCSVQPSCGLGEFTVKPPSGETVIKSVSFMCKACLQGQFHANDATHQDEQCTPQPSCLLGYELLGGDSTTKGQCVIKQFAVLDFSRSTGRLPSLELFVGEIRSIEPVLLSAANVANITGSVSDVSYVIKCAPPGFFVDTRTGAISVIVRNPANLLPSSDASDVSGSGSSSGADADVEMGQQRYAAAMNACGVFNFGPPWIYPMALVALDGANNEAVVEETNVTISLRREFEFGESFGADPDILGVDQNYLAKYPIITVDNSDDAACSEPGGGQNNSAYFGLCNVKLDGPAQERWKLFTNFGKSASNLEAEANDVSYAIRFEVDIDVGGVEIGTEDSSATPGEWFVDRETGNIIAYCTNAGNFIGTLVATDSASLGEVIVKTWSFAVRARDVSNPINGPKQRGCGEDRNAGEPKDDANIFDGEFTCVCRDGWIGTNCDTADNRASQQAEQTGGIAGGIAGFVILMMILVNVALKHYAYKLSMRKFDFQQEIARLLDSGDVDAEQADVNETPREIARQCVTITRKLGSGAFGDVCEAILHEGDSAGTPAYPVAVKTVRESGGEAAGELFREAALMQQIAGANNGHTNLVSIIGVVTKGLPLYLVLSICSNGNLLMVLTDIAAKERGGVGWSAKLELMLGSARGMAHLAKKRFVHRDLAARNVLVDSAMNAKIADFGLRYGARSFYQMVYVRRCCMIPRLLGMKPADVGDLIARLSDESPHAYFVTFLCITLTLTLTLCIHSRGIHENEQNDDESGGGYYYRSQSGIFPVRWSAPESMESLRFTSASDVWSYGILMYECISDAQKPYPELKTNDLVISAVSRGHRMRRHESCDPHLYEMMLLCWRADPTDRPTFKQVAAYLEVRVAHANGDKQNRGFLGGDDKISSRIAAVNPDAACAFTAAGGAGVSEVRSKDGGFVNPQYSPVKTEGSLAEDADQYLSPAQKKVEKGIPAISADNSRPNIYELGNSNGVGSGDEANSGVEVGSGDGAYAEFSNVTNLSETEVEAMVLRAKEEEASPTPAADETDSGDDLYVQPNSRNAPPVALRPQDGPEVAARPEVAAQSQVVGVVPELQFDQGLIGSIKKETSLGVNARQPPPVSSRGEIMPKLADANDADELYEVPRSRPTVAILQTSSNVSAVQDDPDDVYEVPRSKPTVATLLSSSSNLRSVQEDGYVFKAPNPQIKISAWDLVRNQLGKDKPARANLLMSRHDAGFERTVVSFCTMDSVICVCFNSMPQGCLVNSPPSLD